MFEETGDPLEGVEYDVENLETSADREMSEIVSQIKEQKKATLERFRVAKDPDYWFAVCFQSRQQRDDFLNAVGWLDLGVKYINGLEVASRLNVDIVPIPMKPLPLRGKPHKYTREEVI